MTGRYDYLMTTVALEEFLDAIRDWYGQDAVIVAAYQTKTGQKLALVDNSGELYRVHAVEGGVDGTRIGLTWTSDFLPS